MLSDCYVFSFCRTIYNFKYFGSNISSTKSNVTICIGKASTTMDGLLTIWKSDLADKIKFVLLQECIHGTQTKHLVKR